MCCFSNENNKSYLDGTHKNLIKTELYKKDIKQIPQQELPKIDF